MDVKKIQRMFFNEDFTHIKAPLTPVVGLRLLGSELSFEEQYHLKDMLVKIYRGKLSELSGEDPYEIEDSIADELQSHIEPVVRSLLGDAVRREVMVEDGMISGEISAEELSWHIASVIAENGGITAGLSDMILEDLVIDRKTAEELLRSVREQTRWYTELYDAAREEILSTLDALLIEKTGKPGSPHELDMEVDVWFKERERYNRHKRSR